MRVFATVILAAVLACLAVHDSAADAPAETNRDVSAIALSGDVSATYAGDVERVTDDFWYGEATVAIRTGASELTVLSNDGLMTVMFVGMDAGEAIDQALEQVSVNPSSCTTQAIRACGEGMVCWVYVGGDVACTFACKTEGGDPPCPPHPMDGISD